MTPCPWVAVLVIFSRLVAVFTFSSCLRRMSFSISWGLASSQDVVTEMTVVSMLAAEMAAVFALGLFLAAGLTLLTGYFGSTIIRAVLLS